MGESATKWRLCSTPGTFSLLPLSTREVGSWKLHQCDIFDTNTQRHFIWVVFHCLFKPKIIGLLIESVLEANTWILFTPFFCYLSSLCVFVPADIQILMGSLVYLRHGIENSPYRSLLETNQWAEICNIFTRDACALLGLSVESPLSVRLENNEQHTRHHLWLPLKSVHLYSSSVLKHFDHFNFFVYVFSPQLCIRLYGSACVNEHQAGDRAETVQRSLDAQRWAACEFR